MRVAPSSRARLRALESHGTALLFSTAPQWDVYFQGVVGAPPPEEAKDSSKPPAKGRLLDASVYHSKRLPCTSPAPPTPSSLLSL